MGYNGSRLSDGLRLFEFYFQVAKMLLGATSFQVQHYAA